MYNAFAICIKICWSRHLYPLLTYIIGTGQIAQFVERPLRDLLAFGIEGKYTDWLVRTSIRVQVARLTCL